MWRPFRWKAMRSQAYPGCLLPVRQDRLRAQPPRVPPAFPQPVRLPVPRRANRASPALRVLGWMAAPEAPARVPAAARSARAAAVRRPHSASAKMPPRPRARPSPARAARRESRACSVRACGRAPCSGASRASRRSPPGGKILPTSVSVDPVPWQSLHCIKIAALHYNTKPGVRKSVKKDFRISGFLAKFTGFY